MTVAEVMQQLETMGNEGTKKVLMKHGAKEPFFGVKVGDLKKIVKKVKKNHELALSLYDTGNSDAMYLAGLIADEKQMTKEQLQDWVAKAYWYMISEYTVPWVTAESKFGWELALEWIETDNEHFEVAGWSTLSSLAGYKSDEDLNLGKFSELLDYVGEHIHQSKNRVRYVMNGFVIAVGAGIPDLTDKATEIAEKIGKVSVDMNGTACKVPLATDYIQKVVDRGTVGKKRKTTRC